MNPTIAIIAPNRRFITAQPVADRADYTPVFRVDDTRARHFRGHVLLAQGQASDLERLLEIVDAVKERTVTP